jgi:hypothetical protein
VSLSLAEMFIQTNGEPVVINGVQVVMSYRVEVKKGQEVKIDFISSKSSFRQGIEISLDKRKGFVEVNSQNLFTPVFWKDTAPSSFVIKCFPKKNEGQLNIWNIWQQHFNPEGRIDAWLGNSGINIEQLGTSSYQFRCSNGIGEIDFEDLVFQVTLQ